MQKKHDNSGLDKVFPPIPQDWSLKSLHNPIWKPMEAYGTHPNQFNQSPNPKCPGPTWASKFKATSLSLASCLSHMDWWLWRMWLHWLVAFKPPCYSPTPFDPGFPLQLLFQSLDLLQQLCLLIQRKGVPCGLENPGEAVGCSLAKCGWRHENPNESVFHVGPQGQCPFRKIAKTWRVVTWPSVPDHRPAGHIGFGFFQLPEGRCLAEKQSTKTSAKIRPEKTKSTSPNLTLVSDIVLEFCWRNKK